RTCEKPDARSEDHIEHAAIACAVEVPLLALDEHFLRLLRRVAKGFGDREIRLLAASWLGLHFGGHRHHRIGCALGLAAGRDQILAAGAEVALLDLLEQDAILRFAPRGQLRVDPADDRLPPNARSRSSTAPCALAPSRASVQLRLVSEEIL